MRNITLSAEKALIEQARERAAREKTTLNALFRRWLERFVGQEDAAAGYRSLMQRLNGVDAGRHFSRSELNER